MKFNTTYQILQYVLILLGFIVGMIAVLILGEQVDEGVIMNIIIGLFLFTLALIIFVWKYISPFEDHIKKLDKMANEDYGNGGDLK